MKLFVDTSVLVRYLTEDPPDLAQRSARLIDESQELYLTEAILIETAHVLRRVYGVSRENVVDVLVRLLRRKNIAVFGLEKSIVLTAILMTRPSGRVSIADALIWAAARSSAPAGVFTFDRRFPSEGIDIREPD